MFEASKSNDTAPPVPLRPQTLQNTSSVQASTSSMTIPKQKGLPKAPIPPNKVAANSGWMVSLLFSTTYQEEVERSPDPEEERVSA
jgi:hypothetical protein